MPADFKKILTPQPEVLTAVTVHPQPPFTEPIYEAHTWLGWGDTRYTRLAPTVEHESGPATNTQSLPADLTQVRSNALRYSQTPPIYESLPTGREPSGYPEKSHLLETVSSAQHPTFSTGASLLLRHLSRRENPGVPTSEDMASVQAQASGSLWGHDEEQEDESKELSRMIRLAMETEDRALVLSICSKASTDGGARQLLGIVRSWLEYGSEAVQLSAVRIWVLVLRNSQQPIVSLFSSMGFSRRIRQQYLSEGTTPAVRARLYAVIAGIAFIHGNNHPELRSLWMEIKGDGPPVGKPFDLTDPFFLLPPDKLQASQRRQQSPPPDLHGRGPLRVPQVAVRQVHDRKLIIAVGFGVTTSSMAYCSSIINAGRVQTILHWPGSSATLRKIPTCLLYDNQGNLKAWGLQASEATLMPGEVKCERFQLFWDPKTLRDPKTIDPRLLNLPPNKTPMDLIVDHLSHIYNHARQQITLEIGAVADLNSADVWLTVPDTWNAAGCELLREAAIKAWLVHSTHAGDREWRDRLHIITKPAAAAVHCAALTDLHRLRPSQNFMICDAGRDTVDLATYMIIGELSRLEIAEAYARSGANLGSILLDFRFGQLVRTLLADHPVHLRPKAQAHFNCFYSEDQNDPSVGLVNGELAIPGMLLRQQVFDPVITEILALLEDQMRKARAQIDALVLVGGFSDNPYLLKRIQERLGDRIAIIARPHDADTATARGAAQFGLARRPWVPSVVFGKSYLVKVTLPAEDIDFMQRPAYINQDANGDDVCENRIQFLAQKGAILRKGQKVRSSIRKYSATPLDRIFAIAVYTSELEISRVRVPRYTDEIRCSMLCEWSVDLGKLPLFQKHAREHVNGFYTDFELEIEFDSLEARGVLLQNGKEVSRVTLDFFQ